MDDPTPPETESAPPTLPPTPPPTPPAGAPRLRRSATHRLLGGVAGGIGERYDLDPNLVRVGFVVLTVAWGFGALVYLAMWALIPRADADEAALVPRVASTSRWPFVALAAAIVVAGLIAVSVFGHRHMYGHGPGVGRGLFLLWLLVLAGLAVVALRSSVRRLSLVRFLAVVFLVALSAVILVSGAILSYLASTGVPLTGGVGARAWAPTQLSDVRHSYRTEFGVARVDLHSVQFPAAGYHIEASVAIGRLSIEIGRNVVLDVHTHVGAGDVTYGLTEPWGFNRAYFVDVPAGLTGAALARAPHLTLDAQVGIGTIEISRPATRAQAANAGKYFGYPG